MQSEDHRAGLGSLTDEFGAGPAGPAPPPVGSPDPIAEARRRLREVITAEGVPGAGQSVGTAGAPIAAPFGTAAPVEGEAIAAVPLGAPETDPPVAAFADGIQRFGVEGWIGLAPVVRGFVAAGILLRRDGRLAPKGCRAEEFVVAPLERLPREVVDELSRLSLPLYDSEEGDRPRPHPLIDLQRAAEIVERRRVRMERGMARRFSEENPDLWLVVDGGIRGLEDAADSGRILGVIKSHETQFLAGVDLETALTLPEGSRTTVFRRVRDGAGEAYSWYVRLWDWGGRHLLHGLIRLERAPSDRVVDEVDAVSQWILSERAPVASRDKRWDRLLYPIHEVENMLRARAGGWR